MISVATIEGYPPFLTVPPGFYRAFECYDAGKKNERQLSARCNKCFTERVKFVLNESVGPVSAPLCAATAICAIVTGVSDSRADVL